MKTDPALPAASIPSDPACPSCEVAIGEFHTDLCDVARCAETGLQRSAGCRGVHGCRNRPGADCRTRWSGECPGAAEAREYGLFCLARPPYEPCEPGADGSMEDINTLHRLCVWDRAAGRWRLKDEPA